MALPAAVLKLLRAAWTLEPADWSAFADRMGVVLAPFSGSRHGQLLLAKALRSARRPAEAAESCRRLLVRWPDDPGVLLELGRSLRQSGNRLAAIETLQEAARQGSSLAATELCRYGARHALPVRELGIYAREDYHTFASACAVPSPPKSEPIAVFKIILKDGSCSRTVATLQQQTYTAWYLDGTKSPENALDLPCYDFVVPEGAALEPECLAWFAWAIGRTGCGLLRADHDHYLPSDGQRVDPVFLPEPEFVWAKSESCLAVKVADGLRDDASIAHIPLVLMSVPTSPERAAQALPDGDPRSVSVIIPTRDNPELLKVAVDTLMTTAYRPDLVEIVIVDNGSRLPASHALFERLVEQYGARIVPFDEPFNWSRANNVGAATSTGDSLLFLNDDTAMLTTGWDRALAGLLGDPSVGVVGVRMVYPDGTIQHAGFVFGMDNGPQHEGRWAAGDDQGPGGRWTATRKAVAVTGAFLAVKAADFEAQGGFDEHIFRIDFADVDFCMRLRAVGKDVIYCGGVTLIHHESVSRGLNLGRRKRRRMRQEWKRFRDRWGEACVRDPGYPKVWSRTGSAYDGLVVDVRLVNADTNLAQDWLVLCQDRSLDSRFCARL